ncbi:MAG: hypothetical protein RIG61_11820 [Deltaproteobacteria bacterium]
MRRNRVAFVLLLVLALGAMAAYVLELEWARDEELVTGEDSQNAVEQAEDEKSGEDTVGSLEQKIEETRHLQEKRKKIMDEMVEGGIAERIENPAGQPFVYVMDPFFGLSFEEQAALMNVVWSYYITEDRNSDVVTIYDDKTGHEIGTYSGAGLKIGE